MRKLLLLIAVCALSLNTLWAQQAVSGRVTDDTGAPMEGVAVLVKGTTIGMFTDADGKYTLEIPQNATTLLFTFVGKRTIEEIIGNRTSISVSMEVDVLELDEVVVTAVGLEANRRSLGYSIQNVDADELVNAREVNIVDALNSKVAGVQVISSSGSPGASSNIRIRGSVSINGSNSPLFVIDGVPIDNSESGNGVDGVDNSNRAIDINPNDIASLTVLKGPAATALYGIRAARGAVIISTKSGKAGKPKVSLYATYTFDEVNQLPERQNTYAQGRPVGGVPTYRGPETFEGFSWGPLVSDLEYDGDASYDFSSLGRLVPRGQGNGNPAQTFDPYDFFVTGQTYDVGASVSGGNEQLTYYLSGARLESDGIVPNSGFERNSFRIRTEAKLTSKLTAGMAATFVNSGGNRLQRGSNLRGIMLGLLRNTPTFDIGNGLTGQDAADDPSTFTTPSGIQRSYRAGIYDNPYWVVNKNVTQDDVNRVIGYANLKYEFTPWLSASYKLGIDHYTDRRNGHIGIVPNWNPGSVEQTFARNSDLNSDLLIQFNKNFGSDLSVNATVGHNYYSSKFVRQETFGNELSVPDFYHISNATTVTGDEDVFQRKLVGVFGTVNLAYKDYLFLNVSGRNDWSSTLPEGENSFFYPAVSLGFAFTEAFGIAENPILPYGKIRVSWGQVGNDAPLYATRNVFVGAVAAGDGFLGDNPTIFPSFGLNAFERSLSLANTQLLAETTTTFEIGAELKFFNGRLGLDFTYYDSESRDQIIEVDLSAATGFDVAVQNAGRITNRGVEIMLNATPVQTRDFSWDINLNFTQYENDVEELAPGIDRIGLAGFTSVSSNVVAGSPFGAIYGERFQRNDQGQMIIGDDGWPLVDNTDGVLGDPNPDFLAGLRNTFTWKGITVSALLDIREGGDIWCGTCGILDYFGTSALSANERNDRVVFPGVNQAGETNTVEVALADPTNPSAQNGYYRVRYGFGGIGEMNIFDGSWIRLRELRVGYTLPNSVMDKLPMESLSITLTGRNLWLETDYPGIDPETNLTGASNGFGLDYFNNPNTKSYSATLNVTF